MCYSIKRFHQNNYTAFLYARNGPDLTNPQLLLFRSTDIHSIESYSFCQVGRGGWSSSIWPLSRLFELRVLFERHPSEVTNDRLRIPPFHPFLCLFSSGVFHCGGQRWWHSCGFLVFLVVSFLCLWSVLIPYIFFHGCRRSLVIWWIRRNVSRGTSSTWEWLEGLEVKS